MPDESLWARDIIREQDLDLYFRHSAWQMASRVAANTSAHRSEIYYCCGVQITEPPVGESLNESGEKIIYVDYELRKLSSAMENPTRNGQYFFNQDGYGQFDGSEAILSLGNNDG